jgi:MFS family permease
MVIGRKREGAFGNFMSQTTHSDPTQTKQGGSFWRNHDFLLLWSGQVVSTLGSSVSALALPLLVLTLVHSPVQAGLVAAIQMIPYLLFSLPVGALIDRWNRKLVMISCDLVRWLVLGSVPLAFVLGHLTVAQLYLVAFIEGTARVLFELAQISSLPRVVHPTHVPRAYAMSEITTYLASLLGPNLAALVISLARTTIIGAVLAYLIDSISYLISALSLRSIRASFQMERVSEQKRSLWKEIAEGLRFLWHQRLLRILALLTMSINFFQAGIRLDIIVLVRDQLHLNTLLLGVILSADGVGGLVGGLIAPWLNERLRFGWIIIGSMLVWTFAMTVAALATSVIPLMIGQGLMGLIWPIYSVAVVSYRLSLAPDELQGRVNSSFRLLTYGIESIGAAVGGVLLVFIGARLALGLVAIGLALSTIAASSTQLRRTR